MKSSTVNISFSDELLRQIDATAREESRSRSELIREAARSYIERKQKWNRIFAFAEEQAVRKGFVAEDVEKEIADHRREKQNG